nr:MAG TPA: hypothetical protein [Crassvirales sp.]
MLGLLLRLPIRRELELLLIMNLKNRIGLLIRKDLEELLELLLGLLLLVLLEAVLEVVLEVVLLVLPHKIIFFVNIFLSR